MMIDLLDLLLEDLSLPKNWKMFKMLSDAADR